MGSGIVRDYVFVQNACSYDSPMFGGQQKSDTETQN